MVMKLTVMFLHSAKYSLQILLEKLEMFHICFGHPNKQLEVVNNRNFHLLNSIMTSSRGDSRHRNC